MVHVQLIKWKNNTNGFITENVTLKVFIIWDVPECGSCDQNKNLGSCDQNLFSVSLGLQHLTTTNPHPLSLSSALWLAGCAFNHETCDPIDLVKTSEIKWSEIISELVTKPVSHFCSCFCFDCGFCCLLCLSHLAPR